MIAEADIQEMVRIIVDRFHPEKVILFGSYACGQPTEDSDVDLLVVRDTGEDHFARAVPIRLALLGFRCAFDILVRTPREFDQERRMYWTVINEAAEQGKLLYELAS